VLAINISTNFIYGIYMTKAKAFRKRLLNHQDFFNECVVSASTFWKILYTSIVEKKEDQYYFAKMEVAFILLYCFVNLVLIVLVTLYNNKKIKSSRNWH
jgi:hypothetical protein